MIARICDRCGQAILSGELRYVAKIEVFAAYDPLEITWDDLKKDHSEEIKKIIEECREKSEEELMRDVYVKFEFDLCPACQRIFVANPLGSRNA